MKKILLLICVIFCYANANSQSKELKQKYEKYLSNGVFTIENDEIIVSRVIKDIRGDKNSNYIKVKNFFARKYKDANSVIQVDDKEAGIIIGKGYYKDLKSWVYMMTTYVSFNAYHIVRVDIKDDRVRVICNASDYDYNPQGGSYQSVKIVDYAPITDKRFIDKGKQTEAFLNLITRMSNTIDEIEDSLKTGIISTENSDW